MLSNAAIVFMVSPYLVGRLRACNIRTEEQWQIKFEAACADWNTPEDRWARTEPFSELPVASIIELADADTGEVIEDIVSELVTSTATFGLPVGEFPNRLGEAGILEATQLLRYFVRQVRPDNRKRDLVPIVEFVAHHAPHLKTPGLDQSVASLSAGNEVTFRQRIRDIENLTIRDDCIAAAAKILCGTGRRPIAPEVAAYFWRLFGVHASRDTQ